ncbi:MAG TPA: FAD-dependent oxidoreductase, partial [Terriglobales bacterium]
MPAPRDIVIIGAGHNGLVTAFYLAKAGFKPLVLERRNQVGGAAITEEFYPRFRASILADAAALRADIVSDMQLDKHGLKLIVPEVAVTALSPGGRALVLYRDIEKSAKEIAGFSQKDAAKYPEFRASVQKAAAVISKVLALTPPEIESPDAADLFGLLKLGRSVRGLGKKDMF